MYFTLSTFADKNKNINFANNIYSYKSKYPNLFIYPKTVLKKNKNQFLIDDIKFLINKYLTIINTLITNKEKKIFDLYNLSNFLNTNCNIQRNDLIFVPNNKLKNELSSTSIVKNLNLSNNVFTLTHKENFYFNNLFLKYVESDLKNINYMDYGSISIESTEAFIAIDVNYSLYGNLLSSNAINNINFLAAVKIFESIKLYNLSGLIVIDFIGKVSDKLNRKIRNQFYDLFAHQSKSSIEGPSPNGIYEITIERNSFDIFYLKKIFN